MLYNSNYVLNNNSLVCFSPKISWQIEQTENYVYILNNETKKWYFLDDISKDIWLQILENNNFSHIINSLLTSYDVSYDMLCYDVTYYIKTLESEGLVELHES